MTDRSRTRSVRHTRPHPLLVKHETESGAAARMHRRIRRLTLNTSIVIFLSCVVFVLSRLNATHEPYVSADTLYQTSKSSKVALMFLCRGRIENEPVWRAFFEAAGRLQFRYPPPDRPYISYVTNTGKDFFQKVNSASRRRLLSSFDDDISCDKEKDYLSDEVARFLGDVERPWEVIQNQELFSVYSHPGKHFTFPSDSIFFRTEARDRVDTKDAWATFRLVAAEIVLLRSALEDERNQKFVLLSNSCLPFHRPEVIYLQLMSESKSRVDSCTAHGEKIMIHRWDDGLATDYISKDKWRKSWQWFCLKRSHAEVVAKDRHVYKRFEEDCVWKRSVCVPDEHYIPTALAVYGLDNETDCIGEVTHMQWKKVSAWHPNTFTEEELQGGLFERLRNETFCPSRRALVSTDRIFHHRHGPKKCSPFSQTGLIDVPPPEDADDWIIKSGYEPIGYTCKLFARKFSKKTIKTTLEAALTCEGGGLGYWC